MAKKNLAFRGFDELEKVFDALPGKLGPQTVQKILRKAGQPMLQEAKRLSSNADVTGDLTKSIGYINGRGLGKGTQIYLGPRRGNGYNGYHGHLIEYGTAPHTIKPVDAKGLSFLGGVYSGARHPGTAAQPFMRPAFDTQHGAVVDSVKDQTAALIADGFKSIKF
jgi:HK97 gp10 family phage protein